MAATSESSRSANCVGHPTQLYEAVFLGALAWWLIRWRRQGTADAIVLGRYLVLAAGARFLIEFIRVDVPVAMGLAVARWVSLAVATGGAILIASRRHKQSSSG